MRRTRLNQFFSAGNKAYGVQDNNAAFSQYASVNTSLTRPSLFDTTEYIGRSSFAEGDVVDAEKFKKSIREAEGLRLEPYKDTKGYDTVGYGHLLVDGRTGNISVDRIDKEDAEKLLQEDIQVRLKEVNALLPDFKNFPDDAQEAIFSEYYRGSIGQSDVTRALINKRRYGEAAKEFLNNDEYKEAKKNGKLGGITKRFEAVSEALKKMEDTRKKEKGNLYPIKKPSKEEMDRLRFWHGGSASKGKGGRRSSKAAQGNSKARDGGNPGGSNKDTSSSNNNNSLGNPANNPSNTSTNTPNKKNDRPTMADISSGQNFSSSNAKYNIALPTKAKAVVSNVTNTLGNYAKDKFSSFFTPRNLQTTLNNLTKAQLVNSQTLKSVYSPVGTFSLNKVDTRALPLDIKEILKPDTEYNIGLIGSKYIGNTAVNYTASVNDEGNAYARANSKYKNLDIDALSSYEDGNKQFDVRFKYNFKKGGLLEKKKLK